MQSLMLTYFRFKGTANGFENIFRLACARTSKIDHPARKHLRIVICNKQNISLNT